jgi:predicted dehydrogenase
MTTARSPLRVGIAGYGIVGQRRRHIVDAHPALTAVAVCDQRFGSAGPVDGMPAHRSYQALLEEDLDVLFVALPNYLSAEVTIAGLERGLHVFCEKPPARTPDEVRRVIAVEKAHPDLVLKYGFNHRYHDSVQEALRTIRSGELGPIVNMRGVYGKSKILSFEGGWRAERRYAGGGILLDQGIHMLDLMRLFCGDFVEVKSFVSRDYWQHDVEDNAFALMKDTSGRVAMLHSTATQWQHRFSLDIACLEGFIELSGILTGSQSYGEERLIVGRRAESMKGADRQTITKYLDDQSWAREIAEFASAIVDGAPIAHGSSHDAQASMDLVFKIYDADPSWAAFVADAERNLSQ